MSTNYDDIGRDPRKIVEAFGRMAAEGLSSLSDAAERHEHDRRRSSGGWEPRSWMRDEHGRSDRGRPGHGGPGHGPRGHGGHGRGGPPWEKLGDLGRLFGPGGFGGPGFGGFGGPGFGGPRGRGRRRRGRGDVRSAVLVLLAEEAMHGYQIIQEIGHRTNGFWRPSAGSVYPALQLLEDEGLITITHDEGRRMASLTDAGRTYVEEHRDELAKVFDVEDLDDSDTDSKQAFGQLAFAAVQVFRTGSSAQIAAARDVLSDARRKLYLILAETDDDAGDDDAPEPTVPEVPLEASDIEPPSGE